MNENNSSDEANKSSMRERLSQLEWLESIVWKRAGVVGFGRLASAHARADSFKKLCATHCVTKMNLSFLHI